MRAKRDCCKRLLLLVVLGLSVCLWQTLTIACAPQSDPFLAGERKASNEASPTGLAVAQTQQLETEQAEEQTMRRGPQGLPDEEFLKFANWDDKRIKLSNYIAGYIIAHGIDYPVRLIEVDATGYQEMFAQGKVDIVLEMAAGSYEKQAESGTITVLGTLSQKNAETRIGVHSSLEKRAPEVVEFIEKFAPDDVVIAKLTAMMTGGRVGLKESVVALTFLKQHEEMWTQWVSASVVEKVKAALKSGKSSLCREWIIQRSGPTFRICEEDPSVSFYGS